MDSSSSYSESPGFGESNTVGVMACLKAVRIQLTSSVNKFNHEKSIGYNRVRVQCKSGLFQPLVHNTT